MPRLQEFVGQLERKKGNQPNHTMAEEQHKKNDRVGRSIRQNLFDVHHGDARLLAAMLPDAVIDVTITSPPYFNSKDYGVPNQIGFGQDYDSYLSDLTQVFAQIFRATKSDGSLWIVIDTFRRDKEVLPLPFDLAARLKSA